METPVSHPQHRLDAPYRSTRRTHRGPYESTRWPPADPAAGFFFLSLSLFLFLSLSPSFFFFSFFILFSSFLLCRMGPLMAGFSAFIRGSCILPFAGFGAVPCGGRPLRQVSSCSVIVVGQSPVRQAPRWRPPSSDCPRVSDYSCVTNVHYVYLSLKSVLSS